MPGIYGEILGAQLEKLASAPTATRGRIYFDTTLGVIRIYDGTGWRDIADDVDLTALQSAITALTTAVAGKKDNFAVLPIAEGGTGQTTAMAAALALLPSVSGQNAKFLQTDGSVVQWAVASGGGGSLYWGDSVATYASLPLSDPIDAIRLVTADSILYKFNGTSWDTYYDISSLQPKDGDLTSLAGLSGAGLSVRVGTSSWVLRSLTAASARIAITFPDGVGGDPAFDVVEAQISLPNLGGVLPVAKGGTGQSTANAALNALLPAQTSNAGKYLTTDGTNSSWAASEVTLTGTQTLSNKTLVAPIVDDALILNYETSVTAPAAGKLAVYPKADGKLYKKTPDNVETQVGSGAGTGQVNFISNGDFEETANGATPTGWAAYVDAAASTPVDGTGDSLSANVTFLASTTSPLRGLVSAVFTKDAANRRGQGWSYGFTISAADRNKKSQLYVELEASTNYVAGDLAFYIYDVTNNTLITPSTAAIPKLSGQSWNISWDSSSSQSYRLIIHVASTSDLAYTVKFDSFLVNAQAPGLISPNSDWQSFTPTWTNLTVGNGTNQGMWRRSGPTMEIQTKLVFGSTTSVTGQIKITVPDGKTIDTTKLSQITSSMAYAYDVSTPTNRQLGVPVNDSATTFVIAATGATSWTTAVPFAWAVGDEIDLVLSVPIVEWAGSGVPLSSNTNLEFAADDGTNDVFGPNGALVPNVAFSTGYATLQFSFSGNKSVTDMYVLEINRSGRGWQNASDFTPHTVAAGSYRFGIYGIWASNTIYEVGFGRNGVLSDNGPAANGATSWATEYTNGTRFRVRKQSGAVPIGMEKATATSSGFVQGGQVPGSNGAAAIGAGMIGEYKEVISSSFLSIATDTWNDGNNGGLLLGEGVWDLQAVALFNPNNTTTVNRLTVAIGTASGTGTAGIDPLRNQTNILYSGVAIDPNDLDMYISSPTYRVVVPAGTSVTYYPKTSAKFATSTMQSRNNIFARRIG